MHRHRFATALIALTLVACSKDGPTVNQTPGTPASIVFSSPTVTAQAAKSVTGLTLTVRDSAGRGVPDQTVAFAVSAGGGSVASTSAVSNAQGVVSVPAWTFGKTNVPQTLTASLGSLPTRVVEGTVQTAYDVVVRFYGTAMTSQQQAAFATAAARIEGIITGNLASVQMTSAVGDCQGQVLNETVDDVVIFATAEPNDGAGGILAAAGPCFVRSTDNLPIVGVMIFDTADLAAITADGTLLDVITHEMLHVIGFGSIWGPPPDGKGLLTGAGTTNPRFTGALARTECVALGGTTPCSSSVPVHFLDGPGSADSHWRESTFNSELMTAGAENGPMPLSLMTIGSLADLGYVVNYSPADAYTVPAGALYAPGTGGRTNWEGRGPRVIKRVDAKGNVVGQWVRP